MKRTIILFISAILVLTACGNNDEKSKEQSNEKEQQKE